MEKDKAKQYHLLTKNMAQFLSLSKLYSFSHPILREKAEQTFKLMGELIADSGSLTMSEAGGLFLINGEKIETQDKLIKRFIENIADLEFGSICFEHGVNSEEICVFVELLKAPLHYAGKEKAEGFLKTKGVKHIIPSFSTYKLVAENEKIIKDGGLVNIGDIPPELLEKFSTDLNKGEVGVNINKGDKVYQMLAHNPLFIFEQVHGKAEKSSGPDDLDKILWLIGDYLINEISTAKEEETNRKILNDVRDKLLGVWEKREDRENWKAQTHKTFTAISAALELKGLVLLYKKHRKRLDLVIKEIKNILATMPTDSVVYKKTKEDLEKGSGCKEIFG